MPHAMLFTPSRLLDDSRSFIKERGKLTAQKQPLPPEYILARAFLRPSAFWWTLTCLDDERRLVCSSGCGNLGQ